MALDSWKSYDIILISQRYSKRLQEEKGEDLMLYIEHLTKTFG